MYTNLNGVRWNLSVHKSMALVFTLDLSQKTLVYTNNFVAEKEIVSKVLFKIAERNLRYFGINLNKDVEDLYHINSKTLIRVTIKEKTLKDEETYHVPGLVGST